MRRSSGAAGPAYPRDGEPRHRNPSCGGRYTLFPTLSPSNTQVSVAANIVLSGKLRFSRIPISSSPGRRSCSGAARPPISSRSGRVCAELVYRKPVTTESLLYRPPWEGISSPPGNLGALPLSSCPGTYTVLAGKPCRPAWELMSSCVGRYIVSPRKVYRPVRENVSSSPGNRVAVFAAKVRFSHDN